MDRIYELVGMIKYIEFCDVFTDQDIANLKSWISNNEYLIFKNSQINFLKNIQDVFLDTNYSLNDKKELLMELNQSFLSGNNQFNKIELFTIILAILKQLKNEIKTKTDAFTSFIMWLNNLNDYLDADTRDLIANKNIENIQLFIDDLNDNLLKLLNKEWINQLKREINNNINIGLDILELENQPSLIEKIHNKAGLELKRGLNSYVGTTSIDTDIIVLSLAIIAMESYNGTFYDYVIDAYPELYSSYSEQRVNGLIRTILNEYRPINYEQNKRLINLPLQHSIVPKCFLPNFFGLFINNCGK